MSDSALTVDELRSRIEAVGVTPHQGSTAGYVRFGPEFALGSVEIAFGDDHAVYDESTFPGVVYPVESPAATIVVSGDGTVAVVDATDADHAQEALTEAAETLAELGSSATTTLPKPSSRPNRSRSRWILPKSRRSGTTPTRSNLGGRGIVVHVHTPWPDTRGFASMLFPQDAREYHTIQDSSVATPYCATVAKFGKGGALKMLSRRGPQVQILSVARS